MKFISILTRYNETDMVIHFVLLFLKINANISKVFDLTGIEIKSEPGYGYKDKIRRLECDESDCDSCLIWRCSKYFSNEREQVIESKLKFKNLYSIIDHRNNRRK